MIRVLFNIDDSYIRQCKAVMKSILANTNSDVCFYIIGGKKSDFRGVNVVCYEKPGISILKYTKPVAHISITSVYRIFAPFILSDIDKVIYLDSDLIVLDDIKKLWDYDIKYIAGVQDGMFRYQARKNKLKHCYINSGVMIMNLKNLRQLNYMQRIKETQTGKYNLSLLDQDIINIAFSNEIEHLPVKWNVYAKIYPEITSAMIEARQNPSIIHWAGKDKPWNADVWQAEEWRHYDN